MATVRKARWSAMAMVVAAWLGASMSGGPAPVRAEDPPAPPMGEPTPAPSERLAPTAPIVGGTDGPTTSLVVGNGTTVADLLKAAAAATGRVIVWSDQDRALARQLVGGATVRVRPPDLFDAVRDLVATQEVVLVPVGGPLNPTWYAADARVAMNQVVLRTYATPVVFTDDVARDLQHRTGLFVSAVIPSPVSNLREVRTALQRLVSGNNVGSVTELPDAGAFLVNDFAPQAVAIYRAVQAMRPRGGPPGPDDALIDVYAFEYLELRDAGLATLRELFVERAPGPTPAPPGVAPSRGPRFSVPGTQFRVIVKGTAAELDLVRVAAAACGGRLDVGASSPR